jgi:endoglucanase
MCIGRKFKKKSIISFMLVFAMLINLFVGIDFSVEKASAATSTTLTGYTSQQIVKMMGRGWNLGNTFDSTGGSSVANFETNWGNPVVTETLIKGVHDAGFDTIRIPVTWYRAMSSDGSYTISEEYLARVKTIIDYAYKYDMFVILNVHHEDWINNANLITNRESIGTELAAVWKQLAAYFADYDQHLIFEGMNEPRLANTSYEWTGYTEAYETVNYLDQVFVTTVRSNTDGYNSERCLMVPGYAASSNTAVLSSITLPTYGGEVAKNLIVSVHCYSPNAFCLNDTWSDFDPSDSTYTSDIDRIFSDLNDQFLSQGIAVVIGESSATNTSNNTTAREKWAKYMGAKSAAYGVPVVFWDNGVDETSGGECHSYINRTTGKSVYPTILSAFDEGYASVTYGSAVTSGNESSSSLICGSVIYQNTSGTAIEQSWNTSYVSIGAQSSYYTSGRQIAVAYTGTTPKLIFDSESLGVWWVQVNPSSTGTVNGLKVAYFSYDAIISALTSNEITSPSYLRNMYVISGSTDTTVYEVAATGSGAIISYMVLGTNYYNGTDLPKDPTYDGLTFLGWYTTKDYQTGTELDISSVDSDVTAYAKFKLTSETVAQTTSTPTATSTPVPTTTSTPVPTTTSTPVPTSTSTPKPTATSTPVPTTTSTPVPTTTSTPVPTTTSTPVPTTTSTPVPTTTSTPVPTTTSTPVPTTTSTPVPTATSTPVPTATSTPVPTSTSTPKPTATSTPKPTAVPTMGTTSLSSASNSVKGVTVKWSKVTSATAYYVYRKAGNAKNWSKIATVSGNATVSYVDKSVTSGTTYTYTVRAYNSKTGKLGSYNTKGVSTYYLATPTLKTPSNTEKGIKVNWSTIKGATGYNVYRKLSGTSSWSKIVTLSGGSKNSYVDTTAVAGKTYVYTVRATKGSYSSAYNTTGMSLIRLKNPTISLTATTGSVTVKWSKVTGATGYCVYRNVAGTNVWTKIATITSGSTIQYKDKGATKGVTYYYTVRATYGNIFSAYYVNKYIKAK